MAPISLSLNVIKSQGRVGRSLLYRGGAGGGGVLGYSFYKHFFTSLKKSLNFYFVFVLVSKLDRARISRVYDVTLVAGSEGTAPPTLTSILYGKPTVANMYIR